MLDPRYIATVWTDGRAGFIPAFQVPGRPMEKMRTELGEVLRFPTSEAAELCAARHVLDIINGRRHVPAVAGPRNTLPASSAESPPSEPERVARRRVITVDVRRAPGASRELVEVFGKFR